MKAWIINNVSAIGENNDFISLVEKDNPVPAPDEVLIKVSFCGICHTEIDEIEGRTPPPKYPVIPGHQVVGRILDKPASLKNFSVGDRVGVAWIYRSCEKCEFCIAGLPNLCDDFKATGRDSDGGYAEFMCAPAKYIYRIPESFKDEEAAPLLCAGAIGYRSLKLTNLKNGQTLGLTGFGASGHLVLKLARYMFPASQVFVFARSEKERKFALEIGAYWSGDLSETPPEKLRAIIDTTPVWKPVFEALKHLEKGGRLVINAIRKEDTDKDILSKLSYPEQLWMEKEIKSVANITPDDVSEFLDIADEMHLKPEIELYDFDDAPQALRDLKSGKIRGAKVLRINPVD